MRGTLIVAWLALSAAPAWCTQCWAADQSLPTVPFVGCPTHAMDGRTVAPPSGSPKRIAVDQSTARELAYYQGTNTSGVIGPRGWHCYAEFGAALGVIIVRPEAITEQEFFGGHLTGPALESSYVFGNNPATDDFVASVIARFFPSWTSAFSNRLNVGGVKTLSRLPIANRYPGDSTRRISDRMVEFTTPRDQEGFGTHASNFLAPSAEEITGLVVLVDSGSINVNQVFIRMPAAQRSLGQAILKAEERDSQSQPMPHY